MINRSACRLALLMAASSFFPAVGVLAQSTDDQGDKQNKGADPRVISQMALTSQDAVLQLRAGIKKWQDTGNRAADIRQLQIERERRTNDALREVDKSALTPRSDFDLPKDWKARTQTRKGSNDIPLTAKEKTFLRALDATLSVVLLQVVLRF